MRYSDIRARILASMAEQRHNYAWLADKTGYPEKSVRMWLAGAKEPKVSILIKMLAALGLRLDVDKA